MEDTLFKTSDLLVMLDVTRRMAEQRAFGPLLTYLADEVIKLVHAERTYIVLFGPNGTFDFRATRDRHGNAVQNAEDQISVSVLNKVRTSMTPLILRDAMSDPQFGVAQSVQALSLRSIMCVPLISYGAAIGAIYVENRSVRSRFTESDLPPLILFANQATVAIENAALNDDLEARVAERTRALMEANARLEQRMSELEVLRDQLREFSLRDTLTGLYNRRFLEEEANKLFQQAKRYQSLFVIALGDIDGFKQINDRFSHQVGDAVLRTVAEIMQANVRAADVLARYGGEEFILLLPETPLEEAVCCCERLRAEIERYDWGQLRPGLGVTISIGLAQNDARSSWELQLQKADARLYAAKLAGKNRVMGAMNDEQ